MGSFGSFLSVLFIPGSNVMADIFYVGCIVLMAEGKELWLIPGGFFKLLLSSDSSDHNGVIDTSHIAESIVEGCKFHFSH